MLRTTVLHCDVPLLLVNKIINAEVRIDSAQNLNAASVMTRPRLYVLNILLACLRFVIAVSDGLCTKQTLAARGSVVPGANVRLARGLSRLESVGSSPACVWGGALAEYELVHF